MLFHPHCAGPEEYEYNGPCQCRGFQNFEDRHRILEDVFRTLENAENLKNLEVINLQNLDKQEIIKTEDFRKVLERLEHLRICFIVQQNHHDDMEYEFNQHELWNFQKIFPRYWLQPCQKLKSLSIHCNEHWGFLPAMFLGDLYFPHLEKLDLENHAIFEDERMEWITYHAKMLKKLYLFNCPIIHANKSYQFDEEGDFSATDDEEITYFNCRWHDVFCRFRTELTNLTDFGFGISDFQIVRPIALTAQLHLDDDEKFDLADYVEHLNATFDTTHAPSRKSLHKARAYYFTKPNLVSLEMEEFFAYIMIWIRRKWRRGFIGQMRGSLTCMVGLIGRG